MREKVETILMLPKVMFLNMKVYMIVCDPERKYNLLSLGGSF